MIFIHFIFIYHYNIKNENNIDLHYEGDEWHK